MGDDKIDNQVADAKVRIAEYEKEVKALQEKLLLTENITLEFPIYNILPDEVKLALAVLSKNKYVFKRSYTDRKGGK
jgi:hypothetical protein